MHQHPLTRNPRPACTSMFGDTPPAQERHCMARPSSLPGSTLGGTGCYVSLIFSLLLTSLELVCTKNAYVHSSPPHTYHYTCGCSHMYTVCCILQASTDIHADTFTSAFCIYQVNNSKASNPKNPIRPKPRRSTNNLNTYTPLKPQKPLNRNPNSLNPKPQTP